VTRLYSNRRGFLDNLIDSIKQEYNKDTELKESIAKFRKEAQELENSEALQQARQKFKDIEKETAQSSEAIQEALGKVKHKISEVKCFVKKVYNLVYDLSHVIKMHREWNIAFYTE